MMIPVLMLLKIYRKLGDYCTIFEKNLRNFTVMLINAQIKV